MKRKFLIILIAIVCAFYCAVMFSACAVKGNVNDTVNNSNVTDQTSDSNDDGNGENSETPETPENPESGDEDNNKPTTPDTTEGDGQGDTGSTDSDTGETVEPDTPDTGNTPNTGDAEEKQDEYIYTKENGWNTQLLAKTLEDLLCNSDYYNIAFLNKKAKVEKLLFVDVKEDNDITFTILFDKEDRKNLHNLTFEKLLFNEIISQNKLKKDEFVKQIGNPNDRFITGKDISEKLEYSSLDDDFDSHKEECELLTKNVFERLETIGVQGYKGYAGQKFPNLKPENVIFTCLTTITRQPPGLGIGNYESTKYRYLIHDNQNVYWLDISVGSSLDGASGNRLFYVKQDATNDEWLITKCEKEPVIVCNSLL